MRRANVNDKIGEWTIHQIVDRDVTFVRGGETRVINLGRGRSSAAGQASPAQMTLKNESGR